MTTHLYKEMRYLNKKQEETFKPVTLYRKSILYILS